MTEARQALSFRRTDFIEEPVVEQAPHKVQVPSPQQQAAVDWVVTDRGNLLMTAVAGSGKTTTLLMMLQHMGGYVSVVCYNKPVQIEIEAKVRKMGFGNNVQVGTFHSFGLRAWRRVAPNTKVEGMDEKSAGYYKMDRIFDIMDGLESFQDIQPMPVPMEYRGFVKKLMGLAKQYAIGTSNKYRADDLTLWRELVDHFDLDEMFTDKGFGNGNPDQIAGMVEVGIAYAQEALSISYKLAWEVVDFDDMVYMPLFSNFRIFQVNWLLVDEAQDLNRSRRLLAQRMVHPYFGRAIFVGDDRQAIYGFSGADAESFARIREEFRCKDLPLTYTFRCPKKVVELAKTWVSHIEATPEAPEGTVRRISVQEFAKMDLLPTDAILCRNNAPLVMLAFALIRKGIGCYVEGRDIGKNIMDLASKWSVAKLSILRERAMAYKAREIAKLLRKGHEAQADLVADRVDTLLALIEGMPKEATVYDLQVRITSMFKNKEDMPRQLLVLSSIHKAKGKEWNRVFLLGRNSLMPSPYAKRDWHKTQEANLCYVAVTRAMDTLIEVDMPRTGIPKGTFDVSVVANA